MSRKFFRGLLRWRIMIALILLVQCTLLVLLAVSSSRFSAWFEYTLLIVSVLVVVHIVGDSTNAAFKLIWTATILVFPVFGGLFYLLFKYQMSTNRFQKNLAEIEGYSKPLFFLPKDSLQQACRMAPEQGRLIQYLQNHASFPVYGRTRTKYLSPGEVKLESLIGILRTAKRFIFLEYYSIDLGFLWNTVLDILSEKVKQGVDVRVIYDDWGCFLLLPKDYPKKLLEMGIKCVVFNPFNLLFTATHNNRDHRKIAVVDGKYAITGGINLADEYINAKKRFGHWKDAAVIMEGEAAWSFTLMFLQSWAMCTNTNEDFSLFYPWHGTACAVLEDGLAQPFADNPLSRERVCAQLYLEIIHSAKKYIYINSPYLVIDDSMVSALSYAAKSGVDVRIVTPQYPDKLYVHLVTKSYYLELIQAGVKVYEYADGFIHSKTFVSDDEIAIVGTANLDFRSLYLSFECGVCLYSGNTVRDVYGDFMHTLVRCNLITEQDCRIGRFAHMIQHVLRLLAPLL